MTTDPVQFAAATDVGRKRKHNEDNFLVDPALGLFVVADAMGGHAAGEVASAIAVRTVHEILAARPDLLDPQILRGSDADGGVRNLLALLKYAVQMASYRIHGEAAAAPSKRGVGTTVSLLLLIEARGCVAHVGDSRIYMVRAGVSQQVTEDHRSQ